MSRSTSIKQQLLSLVEMSYKAIHEELKSLGDKSKGSYHNNDQHGRVFIVELNERIWLKRWNEIRGVGMKGSLLYLYIQDTSAGMNMDQYSGADYLVPFTEATDLTPNLLANILEALEKQ